MSEESQNKRGGVSNYAEGNRGNTNRGNDGHRDNSNTNSHRNYVKYGRGRGRGTRWDRGGECNPGYIYSPRDLSHQRYFAPDQQAYPPYQEQYYYNQWPQHNPSDKSKGYGFRQQHSRDGDPLVALSKSLSYLLRHGAEKQNMKLLLGGFLYVQDILKLPQFKKATEADIQKVVEVNDKKRFFLKRDPENKLMIRANQGHTIEVEDLELTPVTDPADLPVVVHGTYKSSWELIKNQGLKRFERNHIHFAAGLPGEDGVISGMRSSCQVLIYINAEKAIKGGIKFFRSANNVILSPGDKNGVIGPCYFENVVNRKKYHKLDFDPNVDSKSGKKRKVDEFSRDSGQASSKEGEQRRKKKKKKKCRSKFRT